MVILQLKPLSDSPLVVNFEKLQEQASKNGAEKEEKSLWVPTLGPILKPGSSNFEQLTEDVILNASQSPQ